jgi:hypothetical protein
MEPDAKPVVEHQRHLIPKMKEVVRNEVLKLLDAGIIYPIADSRWGSCGDPTYHCMCSMQVIDITPMKHHPTSITSIRVVQQKYRRSKVSL